MSRWVRSALALAFLCAPLPAQAAPSSLPSTLPPAVRDSDVEENLGKRLDLGLRLTDTSGRRVALGDYFGGARPVVMTLAYFRCPMLCGLLLRGMATGLAQLSLPLGDAYRAITVSFDPHDRPADAAAKQVSTLAVAGAHADREAWPFLVADEAVIHALSNDLGFRFAYDPNTRQYAHPAVAFVLTPDGRISRYLYGTEFPPRDLRLALVEAGSGKVGTIVDRILLTCYRFDPATRRYGPFIRGFMRIGAVMILATVGATLLLLVRADRRRSSVGQGR